MLSAQSTKDLSAITFSGMEVDFRRVLNLAHRFAESQAMKHLSDTFYGLSGMFRYAKEGRGTSNTVEMIDGSNVIVKSYDMPLVQVAVFMHLLRWAASFEPTSKRDQAILFDVEAAFEDAIREGFPSEWEAIIHYVGAMGFPDVDGIEELISSRIEYFVDLGSKKSRAAKFLPVLVSLNSMYVHTSKFATDKRVIDPSEFEKYMAA